MGREQVDCVVGAHWFDEIVGGTHDGGLPGDPRTPCVTAAEQAAEAEAEDERRGEVEAALSFLVNASRVSPVVRAQVATVEDELRRLWRLAAGDPR